MSFPSDEPVKNGNEIQIRPVEPAAASAELQVRLEEIDTAVRRLEEAKAVSQDTMQLEVSI
jgi:hypothetical protein